MGVRRVIFALVFSAGGLTGCGDDLTRSAVRIRTGESPFIVVDPTGGGEWTRLPPNADLRVDVGPRWTSATICGFPDASRVEAETYDSDVREVALPCQRAPENLVGVPVVVNGTAWASIAVGPGGDGVPAGEHVIELVEGTWGVVAMTVDPDVPRVIIEHDVVIDPRAAIVLDFSLDGSDLVSREVVVTNAAGAIGIGGSVSLADGTTSSMPYELPSDRVQLVPDRLLDEGDRQHVYANSQEESGAFHGVTIEVGSAPIEARLPDLVSDCDLGRFPIRGTWSDEASWTSATLEATYVSAAGNRVTWSYVVPAPTGEVEFPDVTRAAGWNPDWDIPLDREVTVSVRLTRATNGGSERAGRSRTFPPE